MYQEVSKSGNTDLIGSSNQWRFGLGAHVAAERDGNAHFDEIRLSRTARWDGDFSGSLPAAPYISD